MSTQKIKQKPIIPARTSLLLKEYAVLDKEIKKKNDEISQLIEGIEKEVKELTEKQEKAFISLKTIMDEYELKSIETEEAIAKLRSGYSSTRQASYKDLWETALTKVNKATKDILISIQKQKEYVVDVDSSLKITVNESIKDTFVSTWKSFVNSIKSLWSSVKNYSAASEELIELSKSVGK